MYERQLVGFSRVRRIHLGFINPKVELEKEEEVQRDASTTVGKVGNEDGRNHRRGRF